MAELKTIAELSAKMGEYVKMETELPFDEFQAFYNDLMAKLQADYQDLTEDELVQAKGMVTITGANAQARSFHKDANRKKFTKMTEKCKLWEDGIALNLRKRGMSADELDEKIQALWE